MIPERQRPRHHSARLFYTCPVAHRLVSISERRLYASGLSVVLWFPSLIFYLCKGAFFSVRFDAPGGMYNPNQSEMRWIPLLLTATCLVPCSQDELHSLR